MRTGFDDKIKTALEMQCSHISASEALKWRIDHEISRQEFEENGETETPSAFLSAGKETFMRNGEKKVHFNRKKLAFGIAAACLLVSAGVAAGKTAGYKSSVSWPTTYHAYADLGKAEEKLGYEVETIENFTNGYQFQNISVEDTDAIDENGNTLYTFPELWVKYEKAGSEPVSLVINRAPEHEETPKVPDMTSQCGNVNLRYDIYTYKFVPTEYELTEEDRANMERDDYYISVGSDQVEINKAMNVTWEKDGTFYNLFGFDLSLTGEEMLEMAEEILEAN